MEVRQCLSAGIWDSMVLLIMDFAQLSRTAYSVGDVIVDIPLLSTIIINRTMLLNFSKYEMKQNNRSSISNSATIASTPE